MFDQLAEPILDSPIIPVALHEERANISLEKLCLCCRILTKEKFRRIMDLEARWQSVNVSPDCQPILVDEELSLFLYFVITLNPSGYQ